MDNCEPFSLRIDKECHECVKINKANGQDQFSHIDGHQNHDGEVIIT